MKIFSQKIKTSVGAAALVIFFSCVVPVTVFAQTTCDCNATPTPSGCLPNPLSVGSVNDILYLAVDIATYVGVVLAVIFLIYAGFKYIAARGKPEKITEAHHFLLAVVIGIAILIGASAIVNVIKNTLTSAGVVNSSVFNAPNQAVGCNTTGVTNSTVNPGAAGSGGSSQTSNTTNNSDEDDDGSFVGGGGSTGGGGAGGSW